MDKLKFQELQFLTLRKEVEDCLNRSFQIMVGGATLVPILVGILGHYSATPILLTLPMTVVVIALLYLNQWNSIMRCGRYIRTMLEPDLMGEEGWEAWLESHPDTHMGAVHNRLVDTYLVYAFYLLTAAYYFATSFIAISYAHKSYGPIAAWLALVAYIFIGSTMGYIVLERVPTHTTTKRERQLIEADYVGRASVSSQSMPAGLGMPVGEAAPIGEMMPPADMAWPAGTPAPGSLEVPAGNGLPQGKAAPGGKASSRHMNSAKVGAETASPAPAAGPADTGNQPSNSRRSRKTAQP